MHLRCEHGDVDWMQLLANFEEVEYRGCLTVLGDDRAATPDTAGTMPSMPAVIAERYSIKREIGHGGMGRVFAAHDGKLDRDVARWKRVKFLGMVSDARLAP